VFRWTRARARARACFRSVSFLALAGKLFVNSGKYVVRHTEKANIIFRARWWKVKMINRVNSTWIRDWSGRAENTKRRTYTSYVRYAERRSPQPRFNGTTFLPKESRQTSDAMLLRARARACKWSGFRERFAREKRGSDSERERGSFNTSIRERDAYRARRRIDNKTTMRSAPMRTANFLSSFAGHFADAPLLRERAFDSLFRIRRIDGRSTSRLENDAPARRSTRSAFYFVRTRYSASLIDAGLTRAS